MFRRYLGASFIAAVSVLSYLASLSLIASVQDQKSNSTHQAKSRHAPSSIMSGGPVGIPSGEHRRKRVKKAKAKKTHKSTRHQRKHASQR